ncbi:MAG TPA: hypothetical protein VGC90_00430, partial [Candidatus Limnocylindrales bacterium]
AIGMAIGGPPGAVIGGLVGATAGAIVGDAAEGDDGPDAASPGASDPPGDHDGEDAIEVTNAADVAY